MQSNAIGEAEAYVLERLHECCRAIDLTPSLTQLLQDDQNNAERLYDVVINNLAMQNRQSSSALVVLGHLGASLRVWSLYTQRDPTAKRCLFDGHWDDISYHCAGLTVITADLEHHFNLQELDEFGPRRCIVLMESLARTGD